MPVRLFAALLVFVWMSRPDCAFSKPKLGEELEQTVRQTFLEVHDGWSSDEVLLQTKLNQRFLDSCRKRLPKVPAEEFNWTLLNLRKAGKLPAKVTKRRRDQHDGYRHLAEIAARTLQDKHQTTTDRIMCDPKLRQAFDEQAALLVEGVDSYLMRKAAFGLRKNRKLQPELVLRVADWSREVSVHRAADLQARPKRIPDSPGVYIFRDSTGYLYVGEAVNLRRRLSDHLDDSDRKSLANYFREHDVENISVEIHAFPRDSRAKKVSIRRAYESELISSRKPRFNVRP